jgi:hypothetical protein
MERTLSTRTTIISRLTFLLIVDTIFLALIAIIANWGSLVSLSPVELAILAFATLRTSHAISYNAVFEWLRAPFTETRPDSCRAGENVHPKGKGLTYVMGELLSCVICTATWSALMLTAVWLVVPQFGILLVYVLAIAGAAELLHRLSEKWEWEGRQARVTSGQISPDSRIRSKPRD